MPIDICYEKTKEDYERENQLLDDMFPDANFTIAIEYDEIDNVISTEPYIILKNTYNCYCYDNKPRNTDYYYIHGNGNPITWKTLFNDLIKQGFKLECNHCFVEGIYKTNGSECQYEFMIGS